MCFFTFGMALYIKPPKGTVSFQNLRNYVTKRLLFICCLKGKSVDEITSAITEKGLAEASECLIEGSMKDRISHFTLRLLCASNLELSKFFIQRETELFIYRLQFYDQETLYKMLQTAYKQCIEVLEKRPFLTHGYQRALKDLSTIFEEIRNAYRRGNHHINVHFTAALKFVSERSCYLHMGYVCIPLEKIKVLLSSNFQEILTQGLAQMQSSICMQELDDPRIKSMRQDILKWFYQPKNSSFISLSKISPVTITNLSCESRKFPLCMTNLHEQLIKHHRLRHFSRIQYTLFLKEIGLSCQDAISLFMKEYSLPPDEKCRTNSICSHSWAENKNRYLYSIEHLYGKKGAGKNYKAHSCHSLQGQHSNTFGDGGCPFVSFDSDNLEKCLKSYKFEMPDIEDIKCLVSEQKYNEACFKCLKANLIRHYQPNTAREKIESSTCDFPSNHMIINSSDPARNCEVNNTICDNSLLQVPTRPSNYYFTFSNFSFEHVNSGYR